MPLLEAGRHRIKKQRFIYKKRLIFSMKRGLRLSFICLVALLLVLPLASAFSLSDLFKGITGNVVEGPSQHCTDSDSNATVPEFGKKVAHEYYYIPGVCTDDYGTTTDRCNPEDPDYLVEASCWKQADSFSCASSGTGEGFGYKCPNGCKDGACIPPMPPPITSTDPTFVLNFPTSAFSLTDLPTSGFSISWRYTWVYFHDQVHNLSCFPLTTQLCMNKHSSHQFLDS